MGNFFDGSFGGVVNAVGGLIGGATSARQNRKQRKHEREMQEDAQVFERDLMKLEKQLNREQYDYEFDKEAEYNSPTAQMQRWEDAGLNPYMMMEGASAGSVEASAGSVSGSAPGYSVNKPFDLGAQFGQAISALGNIPHDMYSIEQMKTDTQYKEGEIAIQAEKLKQEQVNTLYAEREKEIKYLNDKMNLAKTETEKEAIKQEIAEKDQTFDARLQRIYGEAYQAKQSGVASEAQAKFYNTQEAHERIKMKATEIGLPFIEQETKARIAERYANAKRDNAEARFKDAMTETENQSRENKVKKLATDLAISEADRFIKEVQSGTHSSLTENDKNRIKQLYIDEIEAKVQTAIATGKLRDSQQAWNWWHELTTGLGEIGGVALGVGGQMLMNKGKGAKVSSMPRPTPMNQGIPPVPMN